MRVTKIFEFDAAHKLESQGCSAEENSRLFGPCSNLHGHRYVLHVSVEGLIDLRSGMVINFTELSRVVKKHVIDVLDHSYLNDHILGPVTCENMLLWIRDKLKPILPVSELTLFETPTGYATLNCKE